MTGFSPEFRLLAACCRWPDDAARAAAINEAAQAPVNWPQFERLARRHRVVTLATQGTSRLALLPPDTRERLAAAADAQTRQALALAAETLRLQKLFEAAGLSLIVLKGVAIAVAAYGEIGMKSSKDIDLLTDLDSMMVAGRLLEANGYRCVGAAGGTLTPALLDDAVAFGKDVSFVHQRGHSVDLHFTLTRVPGVLSHLEGAGEQRLGGSRIRTLSDADDYAFLCFHGAQHCWGRLKWLADFAALVRRQRYDLTAMHAEAERQRIGRLSFVALILSHDLMGLDVPAPLLEAGRRSLAVRMMLAAARRSMQEWDGLDDWSERSFIRQRLAQLLYIGDATYVGFTLRMLWGEDPELRGWKPPPGFGFAFHLMRVPSWLWRLTRRTVRRKLSLMRGKFR